jgi:hypothetical protein
MNEDDPPSGTGKENRRSRFESVIPEMLKRAIELGVEKARESPDTFRQFVHDLKVPKEVAHLLWQQLDETKNGLFRVVAKEIRDFLEHTNFAGEVQKLLTTVQFEINTTIRFTPNDGRNPPDDKGPPSGENDAPPSSTQEPAGASEHEDTSASTRPPLPKPYVKTAVRMRRTTHESVRRRPRPKSESQ